MAFNAGRDCQPRCIFTQSPPSLPCCVSQLDFCHTGSLGDPLPVSTPRPAEAIAIAKASFTRSSAWLQMHQVHHMLQQMVWQHFMHDTLVDCDTYDSPGSSTLQILGTDPPTAEADCPFGTIQVCGAVAPRSPLLFSEQSCSCCEPNNGNV